MIKIISSEKTEKIHNKDYQKVSELIRKTGFPMPCAGKGTCLKCKVILNGEISGLSEKEKSALSHEEVEKGVRLACFSEIKNGEIILTNEFITNTASIEMADANLGTEDKYIIAIDLGTTVVTGCLYSALKKEVVKEISRINKLSSFGADIMSRIEYSMKNTVKEMTEIITEQIEEITDFLFKEDADIVITGNTAMLNILAGEDVSYMGIYPYTPPSTFGKTITVKNKEVYVPKCISAFAGADLLCGIIASGMNEDEKALFIDIGTNGEIALKYNNEKICTSSPAGPAFEGAGLTMGMPAKEGTVSKVFAQGINLRYKTIGNQKAQGICGSGIIDFIAELKRYNAIDSFGNIKKEGHPFCHLIKSEDNETRIYLSDCEVYITDKDIRNIQLAKSAISSAVNTLLYNRELKEIDAVYIAGNFGNFINIKNACFLNLIPKELEDKVKLIGNAALKGAVIISMNKEAEKEAENYIYIDLSKSEYFNNEFIKNTGI